MKRLPCDPVRLEVYKNLFHSLAEEMGAVLRRTAFSPNIKERRDYSAAVFDGAGRVLAMGDHMPVHLGSMPRSVEAAMHELALEPGDIAILNDPYRGGTHLPDITMVMPVYTRGGSRPLYLIANRAHHADVGGAQAGSMGVAREIFSEGVIIPPVKLVRRGRLDRDVLALVLANVRTPHEREGDLMAQIAACEVGRRRLLEMLAKYGVREMKAYGEHLLDYSERMMRAEIRAIPDGTYRAGDCLDDDGVTEDPVPIRVAVRVRGDRTEVDFAGSAATCAGSINAVRAITESAVFYVFRCLVAEEVPATAGLMRPITIHAPEDTVVNTRPPAAVAGGNVETSQRIVDVLLRALARALPDRIPAASQGTMNNLTIGGIDPRTGQPFAYYETVAGGMGARPGRDGLSGRHCHMTNSLNTPVEALEYSYPFRVRAYRLRRGSGGAGRYRGGDGIVREIEPLADAQIAILSDRRRLPPYGLAGGEPGRCGENRLVAGGREEILPGKCTRYVARGSLISTSTPGGGGWGKRARGGRAGKHRDRKNA